MKHWIRLALACVTILLLGGVTAFLAFRSGLQEGKRNAQREYQHSKTQRMELSELLRPRNCLDDYGSAARRWDCNTDDRQCALSLGVIASDVRSGVVFLDGSRFSAKYHVSGLSQIWELKDGSRFELEPNGKGTYIKAEDIAESKDLKGFHFSPKPEYTCKAIRK